ncbi:MAG TPA: hypothetical protein VGI03_15235 [Verrucomicrobiae bacterium]
MKDDLDEIRREFHSIRNYLAPFGMACEVLNAQVKKNKAEQEQKIAALEAKIAELEKRLEALGQPQGTASRFND